MLHIIASKLAKRHHSTIRISLALLILHKSLPTPEKLLIKQSGSAAQYVNNFDFLHLAHVVFDKANDSPVHLATFVSINASGQSEMVLLVKSKNLQATSHAILHIFTYCTLLSI